VNPCFHLKNEDGFECRYGGVTMSLHSICPHMAPLALSACRRAPSRTFEKFRVTCSRSLNSTIRETIDYMGLPLSSLCSFFIWTLPVPLHEFTEIDMLQSSKIPNFRPQFSTTTICQNPMNTISKWCIVPHTVYISAYY
jgi:hypothetical protein